MGDMGDDIVAGCVGPFLIILGIIYVLGLILWQIF